MGRLPCYFPLYLADGLLAHAVVLGNGYEGMPFSQTRSDSSHVIHCQLLVLDACLLTISHVVLVRTCFKVVGVDAPLVVTGMSNHYPVELLPRKARLLSVGFAMCVSVTPLP